MIENIYATTALLNLMPPSYKSSTARGNILGLFIGIILELVWLVILISYRAEHPPVQRLINDHQLYYVLYSK